MARLGSRAHYLKWLLLKYTRIPAFAALHWKQSCLQEAKLLLLVRFVLSGFFWGDIQAPERFRVADLLYFTFFLLVVSALVKVN